MIGGLFSIINTCRDTISQGHTRETKPRLSIRRFVGFPHTHVQNITLARADFHLHRKQSLIHFSVLRQFFSWLFIISCGTNRVFDRRRREKEERESERGERESKKKKKKKMSEENDKKPAIVVDHHHHQEHNQPQYGTFQGVANYPPPRPPHHQPAIGFPQPVPPPGVAEPSGHHPDYYARGYQTVPGIITFFWLFLWIDRIRLLFGWFVEWIMVFVIFWGELKFRFEMKESAEIAFVKINEWIGNYLDKNYSFVGIALRGTAFC